MATCSWPTTNIDKRSYNGYKCLAKIKLHQTEMIFEILKVHNNIIKFSKPIPLFATIDSCMRKKTFKINQTSLVIQTNRLWFLQWKLYFNVLNGDYLRYKCTREAILYFESPQKKTVLSILVFNLGKKCLKNLLVYRQISTLERRYYLKQCMC